MLRYKEKMLSYKVIKKKIQLNDRLLYYFTINDEVFLLHVHNHNKYIPYSM